MNLAGREGAAPAPTVDAGTESTSGRSLRFVATAPTPPAAECGRRGCAQPGTVTTTLNYRGRTWNLRHCEDHAGDGPQIAKASGFVMVEADVALDRAAVTVPLPHVA